MGFGAHVVNIEQQVECYFRPPDLGEIRMTRV
jgi:hypothetical protein